MAEADCAICEALGYRSCDRCGSPVFPDKAPQLDDLLGEELCPYCLTPSGVGPSKPLKRKLVRRASQKQRPRR